MKYTYNWNQQFIENTRNFKNLTLCLEIGCFEGLTSNYIVDNLLSENGKLICLDPLADDYLLTNLTEKNVNDNNTIYKYFNNQYSRFVENTNHHLTSKKIELIREISSNIFPELIKQYSEQFDLIYIDGDHRASAVYIDAVNSFKLAKKGGYILFDDYGWGESYNEESTKVGIDKFLTEYDNQFQTLIKSSQVLIQKNN